MSRIYFDPLGTRRNDYSYYTKQGQVIRPKIGTSLNYPITPELVEAYKNYLINNNIVKPIDSPDTPIITPPDNLITKITYDQVTITTNPLTTPTTVVTQNGTASIQIPDRSIGFLAVYRPDTYFSFRTGSGTTLSIPVEPNDLVYQWQRVVGTGSSNTYLRFYNALDDVIINSANNASLVFHSDLFDFPS